VSTREGCTEVPTATLANVARLIALSLDFMAGDNELAAKARLWEALGCLSYAVNRPTDCADCRSCAPCEKHHPSPHRRRPQVSP
jgi:hypothetical protein